MADPDQFREMTEPYRRELQVHCYRILGSIEDAEDTVQETLLRAWRRLDTFEGRSTFRAWLYKIASNACFDALDRRAARPAEARTLPTETHGPASPGEPLAPPIEHAWISPFPDAGLGDVPLGQEACYTAKESVALAFLVALQ